MHTLTYVGEIIRMSLMELLVLGRKEADRLSQKRMVMFYSTLSAIKIGYKYYEF